MLVSCRLGYNNFLQQMEITEFEYDETFSCQETQQLYSRWQRDPTLTHTLQELRFITHTYLYITRAFNFCQALCCRKPQVRNSINTNWTSKRTHILTQDYHEWGKYLQILSLSSTVIIVHAWATATFAWTRPQVTTSHPSGGRLP